MDTSDSLVNAFVVFLENYYADWKKGHGSMSRERVDRGLDLFVRRCGMDVEFLEELCIGRSGLEVIFKEPGDVTPPPNPIMIDTQNTIFNYCRQRHQYEEGGMNEMVSGNCDESVRKLPAVMNITEFCEYTKIPKNSLYQKEYRDNNDINSLMVGGGVKGAKYQFIREKVYERYGKL